MQVTKLQATLIATALIVVTAFSAIGWATGAHEAEVRVEQAYFVSAEAEGRDLNLTASLFISNTGRTRSDPLAITVFVVPMTSGVSSYTTRMVVGGIDARTTKEIALPLSVREFNGSRSYRVDFLVFEDGLLTQRGYGTVGWSGGYWHETGSLTTNDATMVSASAPVFERLR